MNDHKSGYRKIDQNLKLNKLPSKLKDVDAKILGSIVSEFIYHFFYEKKKSTALNWCFANIKRVKIFLQIFQANQMDHEIYKEEVSKNISEYSYKTIAKIIDEGISKKHFVVLPVDGVGGKDTKVKNIRPSEELISDFLNLCIEILAYIDKKKTK